MTSKHIVIYSQDKQGVKQENAKLAYQLNDYSHLGMSAAKGVVGDQPHSDFLSKVIQNEITPEKQHLDFKVQVMTEKEADELQRKDPNVVSVFQTMPLTLISPIKEQDYVHSVGIEHSWGLEAIEAHRTSLTGKGIRVAVLDTGIDLSNNDAFGHIRSKIERRNYTSGYDEDIDGHGTHCCGTIFGATVNGVRIGISPDVDGAFIGKVLGLGGGDVGTLVTAIKDAVNYGANVISMSLGFNFLDGLEKLRAQYPDQDPRIHTSMALSLYHQNIKFLEAELEALRYSSSPFIIIGAAGNESKSPSFRVGVCPPAVSKGFISVGALEKNGDNYAVASFSNSQPTLSAPGVGILSAQRGNGLTSKDGTSMAAPHASGVAVLWAQDLLQRGNLKSQLLEAKLLASCSTKLLGSENPKDYGAGIVRAPFDNS